MPPTVMASPRCSHPRRRIIQCLLQLSAICGANIVSNTPRVSVTKAAGGGRTMTKRQATTFAFHHALGLGPFIRPVARQSIAPA